MSRDSQDNMEKFWQLGSWAYFVIYATWWLLYLVYPHVSWWWITGMITLSYTFGLLWIAIVCFKPIKSFTTKARKRLIMSFLYISALVAFLTIIAFILLKGSA